MTRNAEDPAAESVAEMAQVYERYARSRRHARAWAADNPGNRMVREELRTALLEFARPTSSDDALLDIGCGSGWWLRALIDAGVDRRRVHGIDILEPRVRAANDAVPGIDVRWGDARQLPYEDGTFAVATFLVTLSSLPDAEAVERAVREAGRVVAPGGRIVVYEPRYRNPLNRHTRVVRQRDLSLILGTPTTMLTLTVAPPVVRRLGRFARPLYPALRRVPALRTHTLSGFRAL